jgi:hypothetical protein
LVLVGKGSLRHTDIQPHCHPMTKIWDKDSMMAVVKKMLVPSSFVLML